MGQGVYKDGSLGKELKDKLNDQIDLNIKTIEIYIDWYNKIINLLNNFQETVNGVNKNVFNNK